MAWQHTRLLALALMAVQLVGAVLFVGLAMLPMARKSADDLGGLMVLSAQTWAELPPATRPAFEAELWRSHALAIEVLASAGGDGLGGPLPEPLAVPAPAQGWQPPYFRLLAAALAQRLSGPVGWRVRSDVQGKPVYWATLPAGAGWLAVGVPAGRFDTRPLLALGLALLLGMGVAVVLARWLAQRVAQPLAQLARATAEVGQGEVPALLPEAGPQEVVALSQRFNAMAVQVQALVSARTTLLAGVSHDLRTPLARMRLALELLRVQPSPSLLDRLDKDVAQMNDLIGNVLDLARGLAHEPRVPVAVADLLHELAHDHATAACMVRVNCPPCVMPLARLAVRRALTNLLENAMRYAPVCPVELVCEFSPSRCRVGVLDRGPGIPAHEVEAMFQPFQRRESSRSPATGGRGLGLAIVRELAKANGWQVSLSPREGGGMAAWVEMPLGG